MPDHPPKTPRRGLGLPSLRDPRSTAVLTAAEYNYLLANPGRCPPELQSEFDRIRAWSRRSETAKRAARKREIRRREKSL